MCTFWKTMFAPFHNQPKNSDTPEPSPEPSSGDPGFSETSENSCSPFMTLYEKHHNVYADDISKIVEENDRMHTEIEALRAQVQSLEASWSRKIDSFVDTWFEKNKEHVDIGQTNILGYPVDLLPDHVEKHIYKKTLKILFSLTKEL